jgi:hypothetical protein
VIGFRHADRRFPYLWEEWQQPPGRWHGEGEGPAHYFADTPDGAWAEFLRHEEITDLEDLATIERALWAVDLPDEDYAEPEIPREFVTGDLDSYAACQAEARRLVARGAIALRAPSAALKPGSAGGWRVAGGLQRGPERNGEVRVLFGTRPDLVGWRAANGRPAPEILPLVRHLGESRVS